MGLIERPTLRAPGPAGRARGAPPRPVSGRYRRDDLPAGFRGNGPAVIDEYGSTTVVNSSFDFEVDGLGNLVLRRSGGDR